MQGSHYTKYLDYSYYMIENTYIRQLNMCLLTTQKSLDQGESQRIGSVYSTRFQRFELVYLLVLSNIRVTMMHDGESVIIMGIIKLTSIFTIMFLT